MAPLSLSLSLSLSLCLSTCLLSLLISPLQSFPLSFRSFVFPFRLPPYLLLSTVARTHPYKSFNPVLSLKISFFFNQVEKSVNGKIIPLVPNANQFASRIFPRSSARLESSTIEVTWSAVSCRFMTRVLLQRHSWQKSEAALEARGVIVSLQADLFTRFSEKYLKWDSFWWCVLHKRPCVCSCPRLPCLVCLYHNCVLTRVLQWSGLLSANIALLCHTGAFHQKVLTPYWLFSPPPSSVVTSHHNTCDDCSIKGWVDGGGLYG